jgi:DNA-binding GntR family transcriptional regulator
MTGGVPDYFDVLEGSPTASQRVFLGVMRALEEHRMVPGQRLVETDLVNRFGVGRNAVREAIQQLAGRGVVDISRNKSPSVRLLDLAETLEVLDVAEAMTVLAARTAASRFDPVRHGRTLDAVVESLSDVDAMSDSGAFSRARRRFYRTILAIGGNRELQRLFPAIGMHIIYSQFQSPQLKDVRTTDYRAIRNAIAARDAAGAAHAGQRHVERVRRIILEIAARETHSAGLDDVVAYP